MQRYKILSKLLATALLIQGTASYATAASSNNTIIDDIGCTVATGSAITEQILKPEFEQEQDKTQLKSSVIPKKHYVKPDKLVVFMTIRHTLMPMHLME